MTERPQNPYVIRRVNQWIVCDQKDGPEGFAIKVRQHLTNAERDDLLEQVGDYVSYSREYVATPLDEREALEKTHGGTPRDVERAHLAPFVVEWNAAGETDKGDIEPIPAPAEGGPDVFDLITHEEYGWIYDIVIRGYRATGKAGSWKDE